MSPRCSGHDAVLGPFFLCDGRSGSGVCVEPQTASGVPGSHSGHIPDVISLPVRKTRSARALYDLSCQTHEQVTAAYVRDPHAPVTVSWCSRVASRAASHLHGRYCVRREPGTTVSRRSPRSVSTVILDRASPPTHQLASVPLEPFALRSDQLLKPNGYADPYSSGPVKRLGRLRDFPQERNQLAGQSADRLDLTAAWLIARLGR